MKAALVALFASCSDARGWDPVGLFSATFAPGDERKELVKAIHAQIDEVARSVNPAD